MQLYKDKNWLYQKYWDEALSVNQIAKEINVNPKTIRRWMLEFEIKTRTIRESKISQFPSEETKRKMSEAKKGSLNPMWGKKQSEESNRKNRESQLGPKSKAWKGGCRGYYQAIARRTWEKFWNQIIPKGQLIHHIDGDVKNNDVLNLTNMGVAIHSKYHHFKRR